MRTLSNIFWLGTKELRSVLSDWVLLGFVIYSFSLAVISQAQSNSQELYHASIGIVDEDHSELSRRITHAFLLPYFKPPVATGPGRRRASDERRPVHLRRRRSTKLSA